ncbi:hypothetical protein [Streptomyces sp. CNQ085]|uniref:hypothetical protein n=1 Tax=Streptomyces sp. CNQ085 TaxID=2886944 RepID=UPI001F509B74|nr:hypothetical protein [Streptomyces sp. CNQ085]MCI0386194.1 hypothetical protein [Streptomyces sp. CNQ085]
MRGLDALYAEEWPTGQFGGPRPACGPGPDPQAAAHRAELEAALDGWHPPRRHLHAVPAEPDAGRRAA